MRIVELRSAQARVRDVGDGPIVVMTPDCPSVIEHYTALQDSLAKSCRVICFDMPGFGHSRPRPGYDYGVAAGARVVLELMDALRIERATLAFSCANGFYALAAARAAPERIERLVLAQTPSIDQMFVWADRQVPAILRVPRLGQAFMRIVRRPAARHWYRTAVARGSSPAILQEVADQALARGGAYRLADMVQGLLPTRASEIEPVSAKTTVIWGEQDRSHGRAAPDTLRVHVPHAEVVSLPGIGHFPDLEAPQRYAEILLDRLAG